jgi:hypothetical protein
MRKSKSKLFEMETLSAGLFVLRDLRGNSLELTLNKLVELSEMLTEAAEYEENQFNEFLELEYQEYQKQHDEWRNFATTGDPDISPEQLYGSEEP